ncbi:MULTISPECIES: NAD(P)/FAD-dependent oxidoreductase [unclassified Vibrio]|uniref:NAD(P)/FAD-dependent oxidoreductase n=1 Tax=Vibrio sp. HB236076 TaxID=3232307 RepID=A0AB39HAU9_9VIBR|nr:FAD-dependent oxidoreductase [Vibrio sp. HB161653]MDP5253654.1 FAD-dependent oxidoreductase [Vibrio sp. HB161653]
MKIAIIGSGISGLTCAYHLHKNHDVTVYEANHYIGGHTATVDVDESGKPLAIDTGFIVYNDRTYPRFNRLLDELGVKGQKTDMSFSVKNQANGLEYNGHTLTTLFAQKRNLFKPTFYRFLAEIVRFNRLAKAMAQQESINDVTLGDFLQQQGFTDYFCQNYILPMGAAIWSSSLADMRQFPLPFFVNFFLNHGLLDINNRPQWSVIKGGSRCYIPALTKGFANRIKLNSPVQNVYRQGDHLVVESKGEKQSYDQVIMACHSDQALAMINDASSQETRVLSALQYQANEVVLHTDTNLLPRRKAAWAAWNYWLDGSDKEQNQLPKLTYNMNILQGLKTQKTYCVSLNATADIQPQAIIKRFTYHHPVFNPAAIAAQQQRDLINGVNGIWFCGAYWYNGFHEDGVRSAEDIVEAFELGLPRVLRGVA